MNRLSTLRDLYRHLDWVTERLLGIAETLTDEQLDRRFDMGLGSLRATLWHNWTAHWIWLRRIAGESPTSLPIDQHNAPLSKLRPFIDESRATRTAMLDATTEADLDREIRYANIKGERFTRRLGDILLHMVNHAVHHHAQALNMLRHNGIAKPPRVDYLFLYYENPGSPAPALSVELLRDYFAYTDWGRRLVMDLAAELDEAALDRPFEMGMGSIRKNFVHTHAAEVFWLRNWLGDHESAFPRADEPVPLAELRMRSDQTASERNQFLSQKRDEDLRQLVEARTPDGRVLQFPLGVTALQHCCHGTHHRAQIINMLKHLGKTTTPTDFTIWKNQFAALG